MFGIGIPELVIIVIVALLVVGPAKLPELARSMGKALGEFRRLADDVKDTIEQEMAKEPEKEEEAQKQVVQKEEEKQEQQQETLKGQESLFEEQAFMADGHVIVEQTEAEAETPAQKAEAGPLPDGQQVAEEKKKEELAEKIAEGIRVNEPQKT